MRVSIIGWYGTETLGDRAILDGIFCVLSKYPKISEVYIGSLFDFYTERTLSEDRESIKNSLGDKKVRIFDVKDKKRAKQVIAGSDLVMVGGGPLMDLEELFILKRCFKIARHKGIPTIIMGCGIGPLHADFYKEVVRELLLLSDEICLRDNESVKAAQKMIQKRDHIYCMGDPAVISIENYQLHHQRKEKDYVAINFREYTPGEYGEGFYFDDERIKELLLGLEKDYEQVLLVPMHNFAIGGDDRNFLSRLTYGLQSEKIKVLHDTKNLYETYEIFMNAKACISMRYHSLVIQTILNGNNFIFDYTDKNTGKIAGFLKDFDPDGFYNDRILHLREPNHPDVDDIRTILKSGAVFSYQQTDLPEGYVKMMNQYIK